MADIGRWKPGRALESANEAVEMPTESAWEFLGAHILSGWQAAHLDRQCRGDVRDRHLEPDPGGTERDFASSAAFSGGWIGDCAGRPPAGCALGSNPDRE